MKIAYIGYDILLGCLEAIHAAGHKILKIYTIPPGDAYDTSEGVIAFAEREDISLTVKRFTRGDIEELLALGCELVISAGYPHRLPVDSRLPAINIHPALLPIGRGSWPMPVTILRKLSRSGVTIHKVADGFDTGDILAQAEIPVSDLETLITLTRKIQACAPELLIDCLRDFDCLYSGAAPQNPDAAEYWSEPSEAEQMVDLSMSAADIDRTVRAFAGYGCKLKTARGVIPIDLPRFRKIDISDWERVQAICEARGNTSSPYAFEKNFCCRALINLTIYIESDWFVIRRSEGDYCFPCGDDDRTEVFLRMLLHRGLPFRLEYITPEQKEALERTHPELKTQKLPHCPSGSAELYIAEYTGGMGLS